MPTQREVTAWAAGIFEGEGTAYVAKNGNRAPRACMAIEMTDEDTIRRFAAAVGRGSVTGPYVRPGKTNKATWTWRTTNAPEVLAVIDLLRPWLGGRRRARVEEVRAAALTVQPWERNKTECRSGHPFTEENTRYIRNSVGEFRQRACRECDRARMRRGREARRSLP